MNKEEVKRILLENNVSVKKQYGQNFLLDENVLNNMGVPLVLPFSPEKLEDITIDF